MNNTGIGRLYVKRGVPGPKPGGNGFAAAGVFESNPTMMELPSPTFPSRTSVNTGSTMPVLIGREWDRPDSDHPGLEIEIVIIHSDHDVVRHNVVEAQGGVACVSTRRETP